jgi:hypothetical protein
LLADWERRRVFGKAYSSGELALKGRIGVLIGVMNHWQAPGAV